MFATEGSPYGILTAAFPGIHANTLGELERISLELQSDLDMDKALVDAVCGRFTWSFSPPACLLWSVNQIHH